LDPGPDLDAFVRETGAMVHAPMPFADFRALLVGASAFVDLFEDTPERRMAMVTRSVVALTSGVPVIHPPFTEVGELVAGSGAGWTVDPTDRRGVCDVVSVAAGDTAEVRRRSSAALVLSERVFEPGVATAALAAAIRQS